MEIQNKVTKIYMQNTDCGDLGLPEIFPAKEVREHENSVDALCVHPTSDKAFATASHDRTIKLWDAAAFKCK